MQNASSASRQSIGIVPILATVSGFVLVAGTLYLAGQAEPTHGIVLNQPSPAKSPQPLGNSTPVQPAADRNEIRDDVVLADSDFAKVESVQSQLAAVETEPVAQAIDVHVQQATTSAVDTPELIAQHLAAGEYGPALDLARSVTDKAQRNQLLAQVAQAQIDAGEFGAALMSLKSADGLIGAIESAGNGDRTQQNRGVASLSGGAANADPSELIALIQQETSGPWADVDGVGGTMSYFSSGVRVQPNGLLRQLTRAETDGRLRELASQMRAADLNDNMNQSAVLRLISLRRLEQAVRERTAEGLPAVETMRNLGGLTEVRYVFVDRDSSDILIGGPAEAWQYNENGQPVGIESGRPVLQLDDLVTVLRTFSDSGQNAFECSIDPRQENVKRVKEYVAKSNSRGSLRPKQVGAFVRTLGRLLGKQDVRVDGVPRNSRVSRVIVEADYRMKLIGTGDVPGIGKLASFFELLPESDQQNPPAMDALRWWLTMKYDAVLHSPDRDVFEIQGSSVLCLSENEMIEADGGRVQTGKASDTNRLFARLFTEHYAELARRDLVFADLQNVFDLALVAALIRHEGLDREIGWDRGIFAAHGPYAVQTFESPREAMTIAAHPRLQQPRHRDSGRRRRAGQPDVGGRKQRRAQTGHPSPLPPPRRTRIRHCRQPLVVGCNVAVTGVRRTGVSPVTSACLLRTPSPGFRPQSLPDRQSHGSVRAVDLRDQPVAIARHRAVDERLMLA